MTTTTDNAWFVPVAHQEPINRLINLVMNSMGDNLTVQCNPTSSYLDPVTHIGCNIALNAQEAAIFDDLPGNIPTPAGGWPVMDGEDVVLTEADAIAAAAAFRYYKTNDPEQTSWAFGLASLGIKQVIPEDIY